MGGVLEGLQVSALRAQVPSRCPRTGPEAGGDSGSFGGIFRSRRKFNAEFPMFERCRRLLTKAAATGRLPMAIDFDLANPWTGVFIYTARDIDFWNERVVLSAQNFVARGGRFMSQQRAEDVNILSGSEALANATAANSSVPAPPAPPGLGLSR